MEKKVSVIGGGTGISTVLRGLKKFTHDINAIVTMADDGGGSGILRKDFQMLPPGDVRNCLVALSNMEPEMESLLQYRFESGSLKDQNVGNILIAALYNIYGSFDRALLEMSSVFNMIGNVHPVTLEDIHLVAELENGDKVMGESIIPKISYKLNSKIVRISMFPHIPKANPMAMKAIAQSDIIVLGPGSLYTSIIPNLLVDGILEAIEKSKGKVAYVVNAMTQRGETPGYSIMDHIQAIEDHSFPGLLDYCLANNHMIQEDIARSYFQKEESEPIYVTDEEKKELQGRQIHLYERDFIDQVDGRVRHNGERIGRCLFELP